MVDCATVERLRGAKVGAHVIVLVHTGATKAAQLVQLWQKDTQLTVSNPHLFRAQKGGHTSMKPSQ